MTINKIVYFKCSYCGRFISREDFKEGRVGFYYEPDSHFGPEIIEHYHKRCKRKNDSRGH